MLGGVRLVQAVVARCYASQTADCVVIRDLRRCRCLSGQSHCIQGGVRKNATREKECAKCKTRRGRYVAGCGVARAKQERGGWLIALASRRDSANFPTYVTIISRSRPQTRFTLAARSALNKSWFPSVDNRTCIRYN